MFLQNNEDKLNRMQQLKKIYLRWRQKSKMTDVQIDGIIT